MGLADGGPAAGILSVAVQEVENGVFRFGFGVVAGRGVDEEVALILTDRRAEVVMMDGAVGDVAGFPGGSSPRNRALFWPLNL